MRTQKRIEGRYHRFACGGYFSSQIGEYTAKNALKLSKLRRHYVKTSISQIKQSLNSTPHLCIRIQPPSPKRGLKGWPPRIQHTLNLTPNVRIRIRPCAFKIGLEGWLSGVRMWGYFSSQIGEYTAKNAPKLSKITNLMSTSYSRIRIRP